MSKQNTDPTLSDVMISHPDKLLFPADGITKDELAAYYRLVAPCMLPLVMGRPVTLERFPAGIERKGFIQKDVSKGFPEWLERVEVPKKDGTVWYPLANDERALRWMANQNAVSLHIWSARLPELDHPDLCVIDLDPSRDEPEELRRAALAVRAVLDELGLPSWVKTSGSKGFHIVVPLDRAVPFEVVARFAHGVGALLVQRDPEHLTQEFIKADRAQRILIDTGRNGFGATFAAPYTVRAKPGAPVSAPCTWEEIDSGAVTPQSFTLRTLARRLDDVGDLWSNLSEGGFSLAGPLDRLRQRLGEAAWDRGVAALRRKSPPKARK